MTATVPASDFASVGSGTVTVTNPGPGGGTSTAQMFTITAAPAATTWVRTAPAVPVPQSVIYSASQNVIWDTAHGMLYVSIPSTAPASPNTIVAVNPVTGTAGTPVAAGNDPALLSISSDSSYLWVGLNGDDAVQRFLLPGLTKDISFPVPLDSTGKPQHPASLQAAPMSPHTLALVAGTSGAESENGVYVYDDAAPRPVSVPGFDAGGPMLEWIEWGANDSTIYASQSAITNGGGIATLQVTSSGVSYLSYNGGMPAASGPALGQYDNINGLLYSNDRAFNPTNGSIVGSFNFPLDGGQACTADASLGRYYCVVSYPLDGTDVYMFELWVYDLNSYALLDRVYFGASAGLPISSITGLPQYLVRWGNAGLALVTSTWPSMGNGGFFLIDGAAINPKAAPDVSSGASTWSYAWLASLTPQQAPAGSGDVNVTISGNNFTPDSTVSSNCNTFGSLYLPTSYVSSQQLSVTIPASLLASPGQLAITIFDASSNLCSTNSLTFTVAPASASGSSTQVNAIDLAGLAMAWDASSGLLYVGTADYDGAYPNSIVAVNGASGSIVKTQTVSPDPDLLSVSANGQYLYAAFAGATTMTQFQLPGLGSPLTWSLSNPTSSDVYWAGDLKAAPVNVHTTAVTLFDLGVQGPEIGGVVIYDDNILRPDFAPGYGFGQVYYTLAWSSSDQILTAAAGVGPLYELQISPSGAALYETGIVTFNTEDGEIHSDFGTGLIYSDGGNVADPTTQAIVGTYSASGLVAPDSSLNRVFILGQTTAQASTNNFTIQSFDEKACTLVSSITLENLLGSPIQLVRWGTSGLAVLTMNQGNGSPGMLYLIQDGTFVSSAPAAALQPSKSQEVVQQRQKRISKTDIVKMMRARSGATLP
jgi:hypothetical protein